MVDGGCDPGYLARRIVRMAVEDIGLADPRGLQLAIDAWTAYDRLGSPEGELALANAVVYLTCAPKSNAVYTAFKEANADVQEFGTLDFVLHSIAFAPLEDLKGETTNCSREGFRVAMETSAYSLLAVGRLCRSILSTNASILTLTYYGGEKVVPGYNIMGVCKATLDTCMRYMAFDLGPAGVRVNAVSAGPLRTLAGRGAGVDDMLGLYQHMSPMGRNITHEEVGKAGAWLLSRESQGITGEILHVDAGYNVMGSPGRLLDLVPKQGAEGA
jgi:enoyl-[acyl-carrier protein] reductase I